MVPLGSCEVAFCAQAREAMAIIFPIGLDTSFVYLLLMSWLSRLCWRLCREWGRHESVLRAQWVR